MTENCDLQKQADPSETLPFLSGVYYVVLFLTHWPITYSFPCAVMEAYLLLNQENHNYNTFFLKHSDPQSSFV